MQGNIRRVPLSRLIFYVILLAFVCLGLEAVVCYGWLNDWYSQLGLEPCANEPKYLVAWLLGSTILMSVLVRSVEYLQILQRYEAIVALVALSMLGYATMDGSVLAQAGALLGALGGIFLLYVGYQNDRLPQHSLLFGLIIGVLVWLVDGAYIWLSVAVWCTQACLNSLSFRHVLALCMGLSISIGFGVIIWTFDQHHLPAHELVHRVRQIYTLSLPISGRGIYTTMLVGMYGIGCIASVRCAYYQDSVRYRDLYQALAIWGALLLVLGVLFFGRGTYFPTFALSALTILYGRVMTRIGYIAQIVVLSLGALVLLTLIII